MKRTKVKAASKAMIAVEEDIFAEGITAPAKTESHTEVRGEEDDSNEDDESPEMVSSSHDDIKKLREMHEQMMLPAEKRNKKKKVRSISEINAVKKASEDEELDESILEVLGDLNEAKDSTGNNNNNDERLQAEEFKRMSRTLSKKKRKGLINAHARKSRKIGNIDVQVLDDADDIISSYTLPESTLAFSAALINGRPRTNYAVFKSQRHVGPCSKFAAKKSILVSSK